MNDSFDSKRKDWAERNDLGSVTKFTSPAFPRNGPQKPSPPLSRLILVFAIDYIPMQLEISPVCISCRGSCRIDPLNHFCFGCGVTLWSFCCIYLYISSECDIGGGLVHAARLRLAFWNQAAYLSLVQAIYNLNIQHQTNFHEYLSLRL